MSQPRVKRGISHQEVLVLTLQGHSNLKSDYFVDSFLFAFSNAPFLGYKADFHDVNASIGILAALIVSRGGQLTL